eukprot:8400868-Pyramimonas_sp.AAC.1
MSTGIAVTNAGLRKLSSLSVPRNDTGIKTSWNQKRKSPNGSHREMSSITANSARGFPVTESVPLLARSSVNSQQVPLRSVRTHAQSDDVDP